MLSELRPLNSLSRLLFLCGAMLALGAARVRAAENVFFGSVIMPDASGATIGGSRVIATALSAAELAEELPFSIALKMADLGGLQKRLARGERVAEGDLETRYRPQRGHHASITAWLKKQGFRITVTDQTHTTVFARGKVADLARVFKVPFGRVASADGEYTSALGAPTIPGDFADVVLSVNGLQPQLRLRPAATKFQPADPSKAMATLPSGLIAITPKNLAAAYHIPSTLDGSGEVIALLAWSAVKAAEVNTYWSGMGVAQTASNITTIPSNYGVSADPIEYGEATLDAEWAGAIAPKALLRMYMVTESWDASNTQILNDILTKNIPITSLSISAGVPEAAVPVGALQTSSQIFAQLAAAGVTVFAASGDTGSNAAGVGGNGTYNPTFPLVISFPASDPSVTGVGGTTMSLDQNSNLTGEVVWSSIPTGRGKATGGGVSTIFPKPVWQTGGAVLAAQTMRCVPDVAAIATDGATYMSGFWGSVGGTSLSSPIWGGMAALINQARKNAGLGPVGLLNAYIYSLSSDTAFTDITSGSNGSYRAGAGFDLCTGLGTPNLENLISVLASPAQVKIGKQPSEQTLNLGAPVTFSVTATQSSGSLSYQWYFNKVAISGAESATYTIASTTAANIGEYSVAVKGPQGTVVSRPAGLKLNYLNTVSTQPANTPLAIGQNLVLSVGVSGYPEPSYQWQQSTDNGATWKNVTNSGTTLGATTRALSFGPATPGFSGLQFRVVISNSVGSSTSSAAVISVVPEKASSVSYAVSTYAGQIHYGLADGYGLKVLFNKPVGVAVAKSGNVYVTDTANNKIRKIAPDGMVSTLAAVNPQGASVTFSRLSGIAVDAAENLYVINNNAILSITPAGVATTLAGNPIPGSKDGVGTAAQFNFGAGYDFKFLFNTIGGSLCVGSDGNIYVADASNYMVRRVTLAGQVTTLAGQAGSSGSVDGPGAEARFGIIQGIVADAAGNLFVADAGQKTIRKITAAGDVSTLAGGRKGTVRDGTGSDVTFGSMVGMAIDGAGNLLVWDLTNWCFRKITPSGVVTTPTAFGNSGCNDGPLAAASFNTVSGLATDQSGNTFVADTGNNIIRKISFTGNVTTVAGSAPTAIDSASSSASFGKLMGVVVDPSGNLFVADRNNHVIRKIAPDGVVTTFAGQCGVSGALDGPTNRATLNCPEYLALGKSGNLYFTDAQGGTIRKITPAGLVSTVAGSSATSGQGYVDGQGSAAKFFILRGIAVDANEVIYAVDSLNECIRRITPTGLVSTFAGKPMQAGYQDGTGANALFHFALSDLKIDSSGNLFVTDTLNAVIRKITPAGVVTTFAGYAGGSRIPVDGVGTSATFWDPTGLAIDSADNFYVIENTSNLVRKITPNGTVTTIVGGKNYGTSGYRDGTAPDALFYNPYCLAADPSGNLYVGDNGNSVVRVIRPTVKFVSSGRLINLSVLSLDGPGSQLLTLGFVSGGSGAVGSAGMLIRGSGPALSPAPFNVANVLADPTLTLFDTSAKAIASNDNWGGTAANQTAVSSAAAATGAFAYANASGLDAALVASLTPGAYTVQVAGKNGATGNVLAEVYDMTPESSYEATSPRLVNVSCLQQVPAGGLLTAGFVVGGGTSVQVLIRVSGPTLAASPFNLGGTIPDPKLTVFNSSSAVLAMNAGWAGSTVITAANRAAGAFDFASSSSRDSAVLLILSPGAYTVQASSVSGAAGAALVEVYEVPNN